ncbi:hypothetical protein ASF66_16410 [Pseudomonas sp. Leaf129]|nr:hypothetical protein ASF66_16410 [Pseudomonas sp. Leaf129]
MGAVEQGLKRQLPVQVLPPYLKHNFVVILAIDSRCLEVRPKVRLNSNIDNLLMTMITFL